MATRSLPSSPKAQHVLLHALLRFRRPFNVPNLSNGSCTLSLHQPILRQSSDEGLTRLAFPDTLEKVCTDTKPNAGHLSTGEHLGDLV